MKILLVDDDANCLEVITLLLNAKGHAVTAESVPKRALLTFRQQAEVNEPFDVVITDFNMPVWSGLTLAMHIASCCTVYGIKAPVICISGNGSDVRRMNERDRSPLALVLDKPARIADIETAIKCVTERKDINT